MTDRGVCWVFFSNTSRMTTASVSALYVMRNVPASSLIRNSWHRGQTTGIGRECGSPRDSPCCNNLSKYPASRRAAWENGGVLISPRSQTSGLSLLDFFTRESDSLQDYMSYLTWRQLPHKQSFQ